MQENLESVYELSCCFMVIFTERTFELPADDADMTDRHGFSQIKRLSIQENPRQSAESALSAAN